MGPELYLIVCAGEEMISVGQRQAEWLEENGIIVRGDPARYEWRCTNPTMTVEQLDDLQFAQRHLRQCDFCMQEAGGWLIRHEPVPLDTLGPTGGPRMRRLPFIACDRCVKYVEANDPEGLTERSLDRLYARANRAAVREGRRIADKITACAVIRPQIRGVVDAMFASKLGEPIYDA